MLENSRDARHWGTVASDETNGGKKSPSNDIMIPNQATALGEVITTAVITAAVMPFIQTLVTKATEDSYLAAREWLRRRFRSSDDESGDSENTLLVVTDPDPDLNLSLYFGPRVSSEAIRALERFDLAEVTEKSKSKTAATQVYWDEATGRWRIAHKQPRNRKPGR